MGRLNTLAQAQRKLKPGCIILTTSFSTHALIVLDVVLGNGEAAFDIFMTRTVSTKRLVGRERLLATRALEFRCVA